LGRRSSLHCFRSFGSKEEEEEKKYSLVVIWGAQGFFLGRRSSLRCFMFVVSSCILERIVSSVTRYVRVATHVCSSRFG